MAAAALTSWIAAATALRHSHPQRFLLPPPPPFPFHSPSLSSRRHYIRPFTMSLKPDSSQTSPAIGASMAPSQTPPSSSSVQTFSFLLIHYQVLERGARKQHTAECLNNSHLSLQILWFLHRQLFGALH